MENLAVLKNDNYEVTTICGVNGYVDDNGVVWIKAEDAAKGFGITRFQGDVEYVRWDRVNRYIREFGSYPQVGKDDFIPENMVYRLGFKANNSIAREFQAKLADEILPSIRKHGAYMTPEVIEKTLTSPDFIIKLATKLKEEQEERQRLQGILEDAQPKLDYYNHVADSDELFSPTVIGKSYGMTATQLNKYLHDKEIQYKVGTTWCLYRKYQDMGLVKMVTKTTIRNGFPATYTTMRWTHKGRVFINNLLISDGYVNEGLVS